MDINEVYTLSQNLGDKIWTIVQKWPAFAKETVGKQIVRSSDSISANLREGQGRYYFKDRNVFNYYVRGSLSETQCWVDKAYKRKLIDEEQYIELVADQEILWFEINRIISNTKKQLSPKST